MPEMLKAKLERMRNHPSYINIVGSVNFGGALTVAVGGTANDFLTLNGDSLITGFSGYALHTGPLAGNSFYTLNISFPGGTTLTTRPVIGANVFGLNGEFKWKLEKPIEFTTGNRIIFDIVNIHPAVAMIRCVICAFGMVNAGQGAAVG